MNGSIKVTIDDQELDLRNIEDLPVSISYQLEDPENFQTKKSSDSYNVIVPATVNNSKVSNTFHNPNIEDNTPGQMYRSFRRAIIEANSCELLVGKALLTRAKHSAVPKEYEYQFFGSNGDWLLELKEATLYDFLRHLKFTWTKQRIINSWQFDGTDESLPYVFAPVRYGLTMDNLVRPNAESLPDMDMKPEYMRPSLSKYCILFWAFKSVGYKISSEFLDTEYFRRQVMPWTWGNFLFSDGTRLNNLDFLAKSTDLVILRNVDYHGLLDVKASNDSTNGAFDNNGVYEYSSPSMKWTYDPAYNYGSLQTHFHLNMFIHEAVVTANSDVVLRAQWFKNGVRIENGNDDGNGTLLFEIHAPDLIGRREFKGQVDDFFSIVVDPGDTVECKVFLHMKESTFGVARIVSSVDAFELEYFRIPLGGLIDFENYTAFKKFKFLDYLRGIIDEFNLSIQTDPINKVVLIEPTHPYSLTNDLSEKQGGYFNGSYLDWNEKQDLTNDSELFLFSDSERELMFKYKDDSSDGILKTIQDRYVTSVATGKYVLPDRFKTGKKEIENRFFSPLMHYNVDQWKSITGSAPQMPCIVPENISNTSRDEAQNTFNPKTAYYKGIDESCGWIFDGDEITGFPFMFAVNYKPGGEQDPILSYSDEKIGDEPGLILGKGLVKRFYWQRMAIMRNGQFYNTFFKLKNIDISNHLHREHILCSGQKWELIEIKDFKPLSNESSGCFMRKWSPVTVEEFNNTYPSQTSVLGPGNSSNSADIKYARLLSLITDIPKSE